MLQPNAWSCMGYAFSMALGIPFAEFIRLVGHDGSDQLYANKLFRRGFHIQECIDVCSHLSVACTEIQAYYGITPYLGSTEVIEIQSIEKCLSRFKSYLNNTSIGVLSGMGKTFGHAVLWDHGMIYDTRGNKFYTFDDAHKNNFNPQSLWVLTKIAK